MLTVFVHMAIVMIMLTRISRRPVLTTATMSMSVWCIMPSTTAVTGRGHDENDDDYGDNGKNEDVHRCVPSSVT